MRTSFLALLGVLAPGIASRHAGGHGHRKSHRVSPQKPCPPAHSVSLPLASAASSFSTSPDTIGSTSSEPTTSTQINVSPSIVSSFTPISSEAAVAVSSTPIVSASQEVNQDEPSKNEGLQYRGVDWSSAIVEERDNGVSYRNADGIVMPLEQILVAAGINMVRQRVWTVDGDYGVQYNLELARRATEAGLMFGLNLHFSDTWTNPGLQGIPAGWPSDIDSLEKRLYDYTADVCQQFAHVGLYPETITIGNEIVGGLLWPTGHYEHPANLSRLLHAASSAIRASPLANGTKIVTHLAHGYDNELQHWFYDMILESGVFALEDWDVIGVSFYPFWGPGATMDNLNTTLSTLAAQYNKEVQVVETNWPTKCPSPDQAFPADQLNIPLSPEGQVEYLQLLGETIKSIPSATGLNYWEPAWINNAVLGSSCESNVLFDANGSVYQGLYTIGTL
ncbi:glycosyl hydrolase 53 [Paramyrothecium foliicola]|nr:glycosyl hydrolase 53 [Paramyrothecium foliicola]